MLHICTHTITKQPVIIILRVKKHLPLQAQYICKNNNNNNNNYYYYYVLNSNNALSSNIASLDLVASRLADLYMQDALLILRHSFSTPCIQHLLRGNFCAENSLLADYDSKMRSTLATVINAQLDDSTWRQASLPISAGASGVRSAVQLSASPFLSSVHGSDTLVSRILPGTSLLAQDSLVSQASHFWSGLVGFSVSSTPAGSLSLQKS